MKSDDVNIESFAVLYLSVFFLCASTLTYNPVKMIVGLRWSHTLVLTSFLALGLTLFLRNNIGTRRLDLLRNSSRSNLDILLSVLLVLSTFLLLVFKTMLHGNWISPDEPMHVVYTKEVYLAVGNSDYGYLVSLAGGMRAGANPMFPWLNPILPYLLVVALVPYSVFSLLSGRLFVSAISSLVPPVLYFIVRDNGVGRKLSALAAFTLPLSSLFQSQAYLYMFDGLSTLLFTLGFFFLFKAIRKRISKYFYLSGLFYCLLLFTKYPPALWLLVAYLFAAIYIEGRKDCHVKKILLLIAVPLVVTVAVVLIFPRGIIELIKAALSFWGDDKLLYARSTLWDLTFVLGWSPYVINVLMGYRLLRSKDKDPALLVSLVVILLAFSMLTMYLPVTRRVIQIIPVFFFTTTTYVSRHYCGLTSALVVLNLSWWGILGLLA